MHFNFLATSFPDSYSLLGDGRAIATPPRPTTCSSSCGIFFSILGRKSSQNFLLLVGHLCLRFELISFVLDI